MATKYPVTKAQFIRDYVNAHPAAKSTEIAAALNERGLSVAVTYVAAIKTAIYKTIPLEKPANTLTRDQMKMLAQAIKRINLRLDR